LSRKVLGAFAELVWSAAAVADAVAVAAPAPLSTRSEFDSDVANVTRQIGAINDVTNCFDDELNFPDAATKH
jgi:hypothetical protein